MNIYISYFYQIRFFPPNLIPISTAKFDPKWFHAGQDQQYRFIDKRGVLNGFRLEPLAPGDDISHYCAKECQWRSNLTTCPFLKGYGKQLNRLDFNDLMVYLRGFEHYVCSAREFPQTDFALIVYETPSNPCSERIELQKWFARNGVELKEWQHK